MRTETEVKIFEEGKAVINAQKLLQILRVMPQGDVTLSVDERMRVTISASSSSFEINSSNPDDFPLLPLLSGEHKFVMPQHALRDMVNATLFSVAVNDQRAALNGVFFCIEGDKLKLVGCDGNRLAYAHCTALSENPPATKIIIPARILTELLKVIKDTEDDVMITVANKHVIFAVGEFTYFSRMIDSEYLSYEKIIPKSTEKTVFVDYEMLKSSLERASLVTEDKLGGKAFVKLDFSGELLKISSVSSGGSVYEEIPITLEGGDIVITFNCRFLTDALHACPKKVKTLKIGLTNPLMVMSIEEAKGGEEEPNEDGIDFIYCIMPTRG